MTVVRFNDFDVVACCQSFGGHFEQFECDVDAHAHIGGHDNGDVFGDGFDFGFFGFGKSGGANDRFDAQSLANLEVRQSAFRSGEINQVLRVLQAEL